jgi:hypothetical protein
VIDTKLVEQISALLEEENTLRSAGAGRVGQRRPEPGAAL